jgi:hypothetical protein
MRSGRVAATIVCVQSANGKPRRFSRRRRLGEQAVQSLAITSQIALLYPPGIDEWMRRELGGDASGDNGRANGLNRIDGAR